MSRRGVCHAEAACATCAVHDSFLFRELLRAAGCHLYSRFVIAGAAAAASGLILAYIQVRRVRCSSCGEAFWRSPAFQRNGGARA